MVITRIRNISDLIFDFSYLSTYKRLKYNHECF